MDQQIKDQIVKTKRVLGAGSSRLKEAFRRIEDRIRRETEIIKAETAAGRSPLPEVDFKTVKDDKVPDATEKRDWSARLCRHPAACIPAPRPRSGTRSSGRYIDENRYYEKAEKKRGLDKYFSQLDFGPAADFRHLLVETADHGPPGRIDGDWEALHEQAVARRRSRGSRVRPRQRLHLCRSHKAPQPRRQNWASRLIWIRALTSAGPMPPFRKSMPRFSPALAEQTIPGTPPIAPGLGNILLPPSAPCSAPSRAGPRLHRRARMMERCRLYRSHRHRLHAVARPAGRRAGGRSCGAEPGRRWA